MTSETPAFQPSLGVTVGLIWLVTVVAVPLLCLAASPLGTLFGLAGPCYDFKPVFSALIAFYTGGPAGVVLTVAVIGTRAVGVWKWKWTLALLGSYAVAASAFAMYFSGMCT